MSRKSGRIYPGSISDGSRSPRDATIRGSAVAKGTSPHTIPPPLDQVDFTPRVMHPGGLTQPARTPYPVIGPEDVHRARLAWMIVGIVGSIGILGLVGVVLTTITGHDATSILDYLTSIYPYFISLVTLVLGYYFGRRKSSAPMT